MFIGYYNKSVILTYIGVVFSVIGMHSGLNSNIRLAFILLILAGICDMFDGKYARMCKRNDQEKAFGVQIDSLADVVNFVVFPVILGISLGLSNWYHIALYCIYVLAGVTRLGYFNVQVEGNSDTPVKFYSGLPVTFAALIFPVVWAVCSYLRSDMLNVVYSLAVFIVSILFISNIKIKKPGGIMYLFYICLAAGLITLITFGGK